MFHQNLVTRNLRILERLLEDSKDMVSLAEQMGCRVGDLSTPLRQLQRQGLISSNDGKTYAIADREKAELLTGIASAWIAHYDREFIEIAKDAAKIILEKSWEDHQVRDVMLFGSTLRTETAPKDIDLLIIHEGDILDPFSEYKKRSSNSRHNIREDAFRILKNLGSKSDLPIPDSVPSLIEKRIEGLGAGRMTPEKIEEEMNCRKEMTRAGKHSCSFMSDIYGVGSVFDIQVLHADAFIPDNGLGLRNAAILSSRDPTFWYTILSKGRFYDSGKHDFTQTIEDRYPGTLGLFPSE